ncbi:hypothetical protein [Ancylomarina longa]|uniref:T9SS C-terminal target domain-containing protein n=1 Tax=Ancylomarina longa TaxID=2487017 RepID=A0A434ATL1_9BACT|nr:hypothetical protein [Ancylomarina longa]RUT77749.1 hypothetical protein DLK05_11825 [Ancylomarina longa]
MKKKFALIFFLFLTTFAQGEKLEMSGIFLGKNLYVMNPFADSGIGYCVYEVTINGQTTSDEINSSAFEIDLNAFHFDLGEKINIVLRFKNGCLPKIINPEVIEAKASFVLQSATVNKKGILEWTTRGELGSLPYEIQQFRWNKWITVGIVEGKGAPTINKYQLNVRPHTGKNTFRLAQTDYTGIPKYSSEIHYQSKAANIHFGPLKVKDELLFTDSTLYEIYDNYGNIVFKGFSDKINLKGLQSGLYYINYDNTMGSFHKK